MNYKDSVATLYDASYAQCSKERYKVKSPVTWSGCLCMNPRTIAAAKLSPHPTVSATLTCIHNQICTIRITLIYWRQMLRERVTPWPLRGKLIYVLIEMGDVFALLSLQLTAYTGRCTMPDQDMNMRNASGGMILSVGKIMTASVLDCVTSIVTIILRIWLPLTGHKFGPWFTDM